MNWDHIYLLMSIVEKCQLHPTEWAPIMNEALAALRREMEMTPKHEEE